jgi:hypothetical protein
MRNYWFLIIVLAIVGFACSTDTTDPAPPVEENLNTLPPVEPVTITPPDVPQLATLAEPKSEKLDYGLIRTKVGIWAINKATEQTREYFNHLKDSQPVTVDDTTFIRQYKLGELLITFTAIVEDGNHFDWLLSLDGHGWFNDYTEWTMAAGECWQAEKEGYYFFYQPNTSDKAFGAEWGYNDDGTQQCTWYDYYLNKKAVVINSEDGSGSYTIYKDDLKRFEAAWNTDETGWWKAYDETGTLIDEGSW